MKTIVTIDIDIIMAPSIELYNLKVPVASWEELMKDPYYQLLKIDTIFYQWIFQYLMKCCDVLKKEQIHFIEDHGMVLKYINEPCDVINIDHHHDFGYKYEEEKPDCSNWVYYLYNRKLLNSYYWINDKLSDRLMFRHGEDESIFRNEFFEDVGSDFIKIPDELFIVNSVPWFPDYYQPLYYILMDYCNDKYSTHFDIEYGHYNDFLIDSK